MPQSLRAKEKRQVQTPDDTGNGRTDAQPICRLTCRILHILFELPLIREAALSPAPPDRLWRV